MRLLHDIADLLLARACIGCDEPGPVLCQLCSSDLMPQPFAVPDLAGGLPLAMAGLPYRELARVAVIAHKERGVSALSAPLSRLISAAAKSTSPADALVPVPSHAQSLRSRGRDTVRELTDHAGRRLGIPVMAALERGRGPRQKQSSAEQRRALSKHTVTAARRAPRLRNRVILVDDVITTGSTVRVCVETLQASGWQVVGIAVATASLLDAKRPGPHPRVSSDK